jgi:predicted dehydrogenase
MLSGPRLKIAIIGAGVMGRHYAEVLSRYPAADLRAVCDVDRPRAEALAEGFALPGAFANVSSLLAAERLDAAVVATPDFAHREATIACLESGLHVLCEKPLATTAADGQAMIAAADGARKFLMVNYGNRHRPNARLIRDVLRAGELGRVQLVSVRLNEKLAKTRTISWLSRTSPTWFLLSHCVDLVRWLLTDDFGTVYALASAGAVARESPGVPDVVIAVAEMLGGTKVILESAWNLPGGFTYNVDFGLEIIGEAGALRADLFPHDLQCYTERGEVLDYSFRVEAPRGEVIGWWANSVRYFVDSCLTDERPTPDGRDGLAVTAVLLALDRSLASGAPEKVSVPTPSGQARGTVSDG